MVDTLQRSQDPSSAVSFSESIVSMIAAGLRSLPGANARGASTMASFHVTRARQYLMEHLRDPQLSVAGMARALGVSPDYLGRLFRAEPMGLSRLMWHKRLEACRRELSDPRQAGRRVSEIAFAWGFNDAAHFARLFRQAFGASPRAWRQAALGSAPLLPSSQGD
ncbi:helix-turn-helix domain-containing protein [Delftia tsuruhatensis]|uniref:helix-turn-helix domain-containing protein n=1 Tax=Delftia tsuruhatensis TaxID=180282 RepID=UPI002DD45272|nr:helix-turn-helix domain-containing protein [Delftia tsuruhatensis]